MARAGGTVSDIDTLRRNPGGEALNAYLHRLAATPEEAAAHAEALGPPLVLKARTLLADKSEFGAVMLNLREPASVREAAAAMAGEMARLAPGAGFAGFLLQRQAPRGQLELRLRAGEEAMFGPWIGFGQGGTTAELARDEAFDLPPLNLPLAHALIARTRLSADARSVGAGGARQFSGLTDVYRQTLRADGVAGLYRGFVPSVIGIIVYRGV